MPRIIRAVVGVITVIFLTVSAAASQRPLTLPDIMEFREIKSVALSRDGRFAAYSAQPDRGEISGHVHNLSTGAKFSIKEGTKPVFSNDGKWVLFIRAVSLLDIETTPKKDRAKLKAGAVLINTETGDTQSFDRVKSSGFSGDSRFAALLFEPAEKNKDAEEGDTLKEEAETPAFEASPPLKKTETEAETETELEAGKSGSPKHFLKTKDIGTRLQIINLETMEVTTIDGVQQFAFSEEGYGLAISLILGAKQENSLVSHNLQSGDTVILDKTVLASYPHFSWDKNGRRLAFLKGSYETAQESRQHELFVHNTGSEKAQKVPWENENWYLSHDNDLTWSEDDDRLFFGKKKLQETVSRDMPKISSYDDLRNTDRLQQDRKLQVWHGDDPRIKPHEKQSYNKDQQKTFLSVYHRRSGAVVHLADETVPDIITTDNTKAVLAASNLPYQKEMTWEGFFRDLYHVDLKTGKQQLFASKVSSNSPVSLSDSGRYVAYYHKGDYWLFDARSGQTQNLTAGITHEAGISFSNELHDYPSAPPGYGIAGWLKKDVGVLLYDRYDIWKISPKGNAVNITGGTGRANTTAYRIMNTDPDRKDRIPNGDLLIHAYHDQLKYHGFYQLDQSTQAMTKLMEGPKKYSFVAKAKNAAVYLYTREDLNEFPDMWLSRSTEDTLMPEGTKLTDINPQIKDFLWGSTELVEWRSTKGKPLQGVLIKPANFEAGKRYPVLVYYYRYFSQRLYEFNQMRVNHRPNFPYYTSNGYAVFLPDIKFDIGTPGASATAALVPGVEKLIDMGIADPDAIGLHGHSWSGYQTAFAITQTDIFKAAVAGAPVANMTSAYAGIRLGSGLARPFQYEKTQSRIGASLYEKPQLYIENSPIFFADRINTPLLMQFGDVDDAVPWQQGIEMYIAMRRLGKPVIMLQYEGEPHHLKHYPNKVDYTIKMKQFFDHHLRGMPAPEWMTNGEPYTEK
ncbi:periplasmic peptidase family S9 [Kordiimonas sediminis]|uniref:Periplasmic peptidase family S9 n=1 Tax=Kordiimonas sediminis TaxID=1735581 RepID=A0A919EBB8_9PROT|nr:prolyl oligopeptidase family serine peptidase [Kordiimonas sediminis]GHF30915.1 periplasmic peptidase family S9 [Kordiimonas sediminis]